MISLYAFLNFLFLPRITRAWKSSRSLEKTGRAGLLCALEFARDLALIASIVYSAFAALTLVLDFGFGGMQDS